MWTEKCNKKYLLQSISHWVGIWLCYHCRETSHGERLLSQPVR